MNQTFNMKSGYEGITTPPPISEQNFTLASGTQADVNTPLSSVPSP
jgi:hypothetical protein